MYLDQLFQQAKLQGKKNVYGLIDDGRVIVLGPVLAEVVLGCGRRREAEWVASLLSSQDSCQVSEEIWREAGLIGLDLRRKNIVLPLSDLVIAVASMSEGYVLYSTDPHFRSVPGLKLFRP
jgi:predicted nucleic acid-binding protein